MKKNSLGLLSAAEYRARRSPILIKNPDAKLDEQKEIARYLNSLDPKYRQEIERLSATDKQPVNKTCRLIVAIIGYGEESRIRHALEQYVDQNLNIDLFEIIFLDNHPESVPRDGTFKEVIKFKKKHPEISLVYAHRAWREGEASVGNARKYVFDIAAARILERGSSDGDTILISNDADTVELKSNYLSAILKEFDEKQIIDALVTIRDLPKKVMAKPNMLAAVSLWDLLERTVALGDVDFPGVNSEPVNLAGGSCALRSAIYAAIGGSNPYGKLVFDLELTWLISDARKWDYRRIIQSDETTLITDPRRYLVAMANRVPINEMYADFEQNPEIRDANNDELLKHIPDDLDWELFEVDADIFWQSQDVGMYKWLGKRFEPLFARAMGKLGVEFNVKNGRVKLISVDQMLRNFSAKLKREIKIIHSTARTEDSVAQKEIKRFFSGIPQGMLAARAWRAQEIVKQIKSAEKLVDKKELPKLLKEYHRFAGKEYSVK